MLNVQSASQLASQLSKADHPSKLSSKPSPLPFKSALLAQTCHPLGSSLGLDLHHIKRIHKGHEFQTVKIDILQIEPPLLIRHVMARD